MPQLATKNLALGYETVFKTPVSPTSYLEVRSCDIKEESEIIDVPDTTGTRYGLQKKLRGASRVSGTVSFSAYPIGLGHFLKLAYGSVTTTNPATGVYLHTFSQATTLPSATLVLNRETDLVRWSGSMVGKISLSSSDNIVEGSVDVIAGKEDTGAVFTPTQEIEDPFMFYQASVRFGDTIAAARAATATPVAEWSFEYDNDLQSFLAAPADDRTVAAILPKLAKQTATFKLFFDDTVQRDNYRSFDKKACVIRIVGRLITAGHNIQLDIEMPNIRYISHEVTYPAMDFIEENVTVEGLYDATALHGSQVLLKNTKINYIS